jgi:hypothetical protein
MLSPNWGTDVALNSSNVVPMEPALSQSRIRPALASFGSNGRRRGVAVITYTT